MSPVDLIYAWDGLTPGLAALVRHHEGLRCKPYRCPAGALTIGWGHNLDAHGISPRIADLLLQEDLRDAIAATFEAFPWMAHLDRTRMIALLDLSFNLGVRKLKAFVPTLALIQAGDYAGAAVRLRKTKWYRQVGHRGPRIVGMIETGQWPPGVPVQ